MGWINYNFQIHSNYLFLGFDRGKFMRGIMIRVLILGLVSQLSGCAHFLDNSLSIKIKVPFSILFLFDLETISEISSDDLFILKIIK